MVVRTIHYENGSANSCRTGAQGEERFRTYCTDNGISCFQPISPDSKSDFIIDWPEEGYVAVNVKTMYWRKRHQHYQCHLKTRCGGGKSRAYTHSEIDYFIIVNVPYEKIWMVPLGSTCSKHSLTWHPPEKTIRRKTSFAWDPYLIKSGNESIFHSDLVKVR